MILRFKLSERTCIYIYIKFAKHAEKFFQLCFHSFLSCSFFASFASHLIFAFCIILFYFPLVFLSFFFSRSLFFFLFGQFWVDSMKRKRSKRAKPKEQKDASLQVFFLFSILPLTS